MIKVIYQNVVLVKMKTMMIVNRRKEGAHIRPQMMMHQLYLHPAVVRQLQVLPCLWP